MLRWNKAKIIEPESRSSFQNQAWVRAQVPHSLLLSLNDGKTWFDASGRARLTSTKISLGDLEQAQLCLQARA